MKNKNKKKINEEIKILELLIYTEPLQTEIIEKKEKLKQNTIKIDIDDLKYLIDSSVISIFGIIKANKIIYKLKKDLTSKIVNNKYILTTNIESLKFLMTSIALIKSNEYNIRIKIKEK